MGRCIIFGLNKSFYSVKIEFLSGRRRRSIPAAAPARDGGGVVVFWGVRPAREPSGRGGGTKTGVRGNRAPGRIPHKLTGGRFT